MSFTETISHPSEMTTQLPRRTFGPWTAFLIRIAIATSCLVISATVVYLDRTGYRDANGDGVSLLDAIYYSTVSLSTTGYGDITPMSAHARLYNVIVITPLRFIFLTVLVSTTVEVLTARGRAALQVSRWRRKVNEHTVVIGYGIKGRTAVRTLIESGVPARSIVVVTDNPSAAAEANRAGCISVCGDAQREEVLRDAVVERASNVVVCLDADQTSVLVVLAVRRLNERTRIVVSVRESRNAAVVRQSGADNLITTAESAGKMLATSLITPSTGAVLDDLMDPGEGLELSERKITKAENGLHLSNLAERGELVLEVIRAGQHWRFDTPEAHVLQENDSIVYVRAV